jgi:alpha-methylacyl-CoA racemase
LLAAGNWSNTAGSNLLDGGAPFYDCYECADGGFISIGPIEPQFYAELLQRCLITDPLMQPQMNTKLWPQQKQQLSKLFISKNRAQWCQLLEASDVCFAPVLDMNEATQHPHNLARNTFVEADGQLQPAPAPRFSRTLSAIAGSPPTPDQHRAAILRDWL